MPSPFVVNLKNPRDTPEEIADKLNSLTYAIDAKVIKGAVPRDDYDAFKDKTTKYINGTSERQKINNSDLRYHGAGAGINTVAHDGTLSGLGTVGSPLSVVSSGGSGTVTSVSVATANGVSGVVATPTTTPAITLTLGAITPTTVNGNTFTTGSSTYTGTASQTYTFPTTTATIARTDAANTFTGAQTFSNAVVNTNNAIAASSNAATVPVTARLNTVTNNSAATLTITMTTTSAVDGQMTVVRILDSSAATQTIAWVNTENSTVSAPTTSNGSTTLFLTVGFIYNSATTKWRCIASA